MTRFTQVWIGGPISVIQMFNIKSLKYDIFTFQKFLWNGLKIVSVKASLFEEQTKSIHNDVTSKLVQTLDKVAQKIVLP